MADHTTKSDMKTCLAAAGLTMEDWNRGLTDEEMRMLDMARMQQVSVNKLMDDVSCNIGGGD